MAVRLVLRGRAPGGRLLRAQRRAHARQRKRQLHRILLQRHLTARRRTRVRRGR